MRLLVPLASGLDRQGFWVFSRLFHPWSTVPHLAWPLANLHEAIDSSSVLGLTRSPDYTPAFHKAIVILCATWEIKKSNSVTHKSTTFTSRHPGMLLLSIVFFILGLIYFLHVGVWGVWSACSDGHVESEDNFMESPHPLNLSMASRG